MSDLIPDEEREARAEAARIWQISPGIDPTDKVDAMRSHSAFVRGWLARGRRVSPVTREALSINTVNNLLYAYDHDPNFGVREFHAKLLDLLSVSPPAEEPTHFVGYVRSRQSGKTQRLIDSILAQANTRGLDLRLIERAVTVTEEMVEKSARAGHEYLRAMRPQNHGPYAAWEELDEGYRVYLRGIQRAALTAAFGVPPAEVEPRIVNTVEELDALPPESVVRDADGDVYEFMQVKFSDQTIDNRWRCPGREGVMTAADIALPATVLFVPVSPESEGKK